MISFFTNKKILEFSRIFFVFSIDKHIIMCYYNYRKEVNDMDLIEKVIALASSIINLFAAVIAFKAIKKGK